MSDSTLPKRNITAEVFNVIKDVILILALIAAVAGFFAWLNAINVDIAVIKGSIQYINRDIDSIKTDLKTHSGGTR